MKIDLRRPVPIPLVGFLLLLAVMSFGWLLATFLAGKLDLAVLERSLIEFSSEIVKVLLVGSLAGVVVDLYLRRIIDPGTEVLPKKSGISCIYDSRSSAVEDLLSQVVDPHTTTISIAGLSLRPMFSGGMLQNLWNAIWSRLKEEHEKKVPEGSRLCVRILLLNPQSIEGTFRSRVEKGSITGRGLQFDVQMALSQIENVHKAIYGQEEPKFLQVRLYEHSSFGFFFLSPTTAFAEQYCYVNHARHGTLPLIKYRSGTEAHAHFSHSYELIWKSAREGRLTKYEVGIAEGIHDAGMVNIFRHDMRYQLGLRQIDCIRSTPPGGVVSIQAMTGKFYTQPTALKVIRDISSPREDGEFVAIRFLIINPVSQQAILRAVADSGPQDQMGKALEEWNWESHRRSPLYTDATQVMRYCSDLQKLGCRIDLRLTPAPLTSSLLLTPDSAFIEQYVYGRSERLQKGVVLGAEFPVFEFDMKKVDIEDKVEQEILRAAFDVMWNLFSVALAEYKESVQEQDFYTSLNLVRASREEKSLEILTS